MYLHIVPKLFHRMSNKCSLKSISIPEIDFLVNSDSLSVGRPWPNKCVWVGMQKGRRAVNGLILHTDKKPRYFTTRYTWDIEDMGVIHHQINTHIEDDEFDMVSQEILLNGAFDKWSDRVHSAYENKPPAIIQPKMESLLNKPGEYSHDIWKEFGWGDFLVSREENLLLHTIQPERLNTDISLFRRQPSINGALLI
ncbi:hypothetical protein KED40_004657 [Escherichia coli]|uniref:DUF6012 family protein n=1 Tax=Escherichia coli TaxID=562 RepID=UPI0005C5D8BD|nr:DUF6012 family protein [Escherichia coli]EGM9638937.1 hypothetical protein [Escherichia coli]EHL6318990.1 hypothetical protein [Escherichia coli]EHO7054839.1 hypothetical protein [Escherichia coli]EIY2766497.1 hypothetical protein [Escherichia coli]HBC0657665.1 hypothetical protein [Escherichia coli]